MICLLGKRLCNCEVKSTITMEHNKVYGINISLDNIEMKKNVVYGMTDRH